MISATRNLAEIQVHLEILALSLVPENLLTTVSCLGSSLRDTSICWPISDYDYAILVFPIAPLLQFIFSAPSLQVVCFLLEIPLVL